MKFDEEINEKDQEKILSFVCQVLCPHDHQFCEDHGLIIKDKEGGLCSLCKTKQTKE